MRVEITAAEWAQAVSRAREVGQAMGAERAAVVAARAAVEALGLTVPVITEEIDVGPGRRAPDRPEPGPEPERPRRDLRVAARVPAPTDGYCAHCKTVYGAEALAEMDDGNRLCPRHGTAVTDVTEVAEGRYHLGARPPRGARTRAASRPDPCGAPVGGHPCALDAGHDGRHDPRTAA